MGRKTQILKSREQRLAECEMHLYFLWDALRIYPDQPDRFRQVATELRVLVADHKPKQRLLIAMMAEYGFSYDVQPPGPPFDKQPIPMIGWQDDPTQQELTAELQDAAGSKEKIDAELRKQAALRRPVPFPEYVEKGLAVYIRPYDYSFLQLTQAVAQQLGSSHESTTIDEPIWQLQQFIIGGEQGHIAPLIAFANTIIAVGLNFIMFVIERHGYKPAYFLNGKPPSPG